MASLNSSTGSAQRSAQGNGCPVFPHSEKGIGNERGLKAIDFFPCSRISTSFPFRQWYDEYFSGANYITGSKLFPLRTAQLY